ncbi:MAG: ornithine carbamoyltransferase [Spirochaetes bacterium]|nr:ornithine carbamoyltransferase [Spirochaetota bacterium]
MKIPNMASKHLLTVSDLTQKEILALFKFTAKLKAMHKARQRHDLLKGKVLAMIFEKSSTRTRVSFEVGMFQLGGHALFLSKDDIQLGRGETIADTARVLSRYVDAIMIRTFEQEKAEELAHHSSVPVINGLTDTHHPCQALADFFTIFECNKTFKGIKIAYIGDGNNVAHSLMLCGAILGAHVAVATPKQYRPADFVTEEAMILAQKNGGHIELTTDAREAAKDAHYLYTDVWVSMGQEKDKENKLAAFREYRITKDLLSQAAQGCKIMHCLPAHRGEEIESEVMDSEASIVFDQAENRLHVQKALLTILIRGHHS